ncbi:unnamed protein product, partial [Polarella glacialis]
MALEMAAASPRFVARERTSNNIRADFLPTARTSLTAVTLRRRQGPLPEGQTFRSGLTCALASAALLRVTSGGFRSRRLCRGSRRASSGSHCAESPGDLLRYWRRGRLEQLAPAIVCSWARTDSFLRGIDAGFHFKDVGPLVGCPPVVWVYFVSRSSGASEVQTLFQQACDAMQSYSVLSSSAGRISSDRAEVESDAAAPDQFDV